MSTSAAQTLRPSITPADRRAPGGQRRNHGVESLRRSYDVDVQLSEPQRCDARERCVVEPAEVRGQAHAGGPSHSAS